jgi:ketosteroid isomerase-like protein
MQDQLMSTDDVAALVDEYLQLCEDRQLEQATQFLAPDALLIFPGGRVFQSLQEMAAASTSRYRWVRKQRQQYFVGSTGDATTVTSLGMLYGEALDGAPFSSARYADVFVIRDGRIAEQHVYNDLGLAGLGTAAQ